MFIKNIDATSEEYVGDSLCEEHKQHCLKWGEDYKSFNYNYTIDDCCLVRTTLHFPFNGVIKTPKNAFAVSKGEINGIDEALSYILDDLPDEEKLAAFKKFSIYVRVYRETSHYTINGLVGSHLYGNFEGNPFIIIEPLKHHILDESLGSIRVEDTYFTDDVNLSNDAVIIIREEVYEQIKDLEEYQSFLANHKVYTFTGENEQLAVANVLNELGYDCFITNSHGYINGTGDGEPAKKMCNFVSDFALNNGIKTESHFYSDINAKNNRDMFNEQKETSVKICKIMCKVLKKDEITTNKLVRIVEGYTYSGIQPLIDLINEFGLERLEQLVEQINQIKLAEIEMLKQQENSKKM